MVAAQHSPSNIRRSVNQLAPGTKRFQQLQRLQVQRTADLAPLSALQVVPTWSLKGSQTEL